MKKGLSKELQELLNQLTADKAFMENRGSVNSVKMNLIEHLIKSTENPTQFLKALDEFHSIGRVLGNKLAKLRRQGKELSYVHAVKALKSKNYLLPGEVVNDAVPYTAVMLNVPKTMHLINWLVYGYWYNLEGYVLKDRKIGEIYEHTLAMIPELLLKFPQLEVLIKIAGKIIARDSGWELQAAYYDEVVRNFDLPRIKGQSYYTLGGYQYNGAQVWSQYTWKDHHEGDKVYPSTNVVLYLYPGAMEDVLHHIPNRQRENIAAWQLNLPLMEMTKRGPTKQIGIHTEDLHSQFQSQFPMYASSEACQGYGLLYNPPDNYRRFYSSNEPGKKDFQLILSQC